MRNLVYQGVKARRGKAIKVKIKVNLGLSLKIRPNKVLCRKMREVNKDLYPRWLDKVKVNLRVKKM